MIRNRKPKRFREDSFDTNLNISINPQGQSGGGTTLGDNVPKVEFKSNEELLSDPNTPGVVKPIIRASDKLDNLVKTGANIAGDFGNYLNTSGASGVSQDVYEFGKNLANSLIEGAEEGGADVLNFQRKLEQGKYTKYLPEKDMIAQAYGAGKFALGMTKRALEYGNELGTGTAELGLKGVKEALDVFGLKDTGAYRGLQKADDYIDTQQQDAKELYAREGMEKVGGVVADFGLAGGITNKVAGGLNKARLIENATSKSGNLGKIAKESLDVKPEYKNIWVGDGVERVLVNKDKIDLQNKVANKLNFANEAKAGVMEGTVSGTAGALSSDEINSTDDFVKQIALEAGIGLVADISFKGIGETIKAGKTYAPELINKLKEAGANQEQIVSVLKTVNEKKNLFVEGYSEKPSGTTLGSGPGYDFLKRTEQGINRAFSVGERKLLNFYDKNGNLVTHNSQVEKTEIESGDKIGNVLKLPEVYKLDERLKDTKVFVDDKMPSIAEYNFNEDFITVRDFDLIKSKEGVSYLIHELQHRYDFLNQTERLKQAFKKYPFDVKNEERYLGNLFEERAFKTEIWELSEKYGIKEAEAIIKKSLGYENKSDIFKRNLDKLFYDINLRHKGALSSQVFSRNPSRAGKGNRTYGESSSFLRKEFGDDTSGKGEKSGSDIVPNTSEAKNGGASQGNREANGGKVASGESNYNGPGVFGNENGLEPTNLNNNYGRETIDNTDLGAGPERIPQSEQISTGKDGENGEGASRKETGRFGSTGVNQSGTGPSLGNKGRFSINERARGILESKNYSTNRGDYTDEEIEVLKAYTGAGGKGNAGADGRGLLDEYYTPKEIVKKMWDLAKTHSGENGIKKAFEPTVGVGRFFEFAPDGVSLHGMEIDKVSGTISKILYPKSNIDIGDFQDLFIDKFGRKKNPGDVNGTFDLVIGNPPYGPRNTRQKGLGEKKEFGKQEDYFIDRGLDLVNKNGLLVYIVPSSFLKNIASKSKESISSKGKLIDAYRLPEGVFEDTTIGTDILVFRKAKGDLENISNDSFFRKNPSNILGDVELRVNRFGKEETYVKGGKENLDKINPHPNPLPKGDGINGNIKEIQKKSQDTEKKLENTDKGQDKANLYFEEISDKAVILKGDTLPFKDRIKSAGGFWLKNRSAWMFPKSKLDKVKEKLSDILNGETTFRKGDNEALTNAVSKIKENRQAEKAEFKRGIEERRQRRAEELKTSKYKILDKNHKIDIVETQPIGEYKANQKELELLREIKDDGSVPFKEELKDKLNYYKGKYYHDINYFSGNIYEKLDQLGADYGAELLTKEQYKKQEEGLTKILPKGKTIREIEFDPLDRFVTEMDSGEIKEFEIHSGYGRETKKVKENLSVQGAFKEYVRNLSHGAFLGTIEKWDIINQIERNQLRRGAKAVLGDIKSETRRLFNHFIKNNLNKEAQEKIAEKFNREKNAYVRPKYQDLPLEISLMAHKFKGKEFELSKIQKEGVGFLVHKGSGLIAYGVGVGKTHTGIVSTVANMQKGWTKKPLFIVPGPTLHKTWIKTIKAMFPEITINNLEGLQSNVVRGLKKERGNDPKTWIKDGEISVITHDGLLKLGLTDDTLESALGDITDAMSSRDTGRSKRAIQVEKGKIDETLGKALKGSGDITIEDLGIDHITVDEVHNFRKVFQGAKMEKEEVGDGENGSGGAKARYGNVVGGTPSTRAQKLFVISQYIQKNNNDRNVFLLSATPFENHATEVYNILSFIGRKRLKELGIFNINDFYSNFSKFETSLEMKPDGSFADKEVMKSFANLPELQELLREFIDYKEDPTLVRPDKEVLTPQLQMTDLQQEIDRKILEDLNDSDNTAKSLVAIGQKQSLAISPYFTKYADTSSPKELVENSPKIKYAVEMIKDLKENPKTKDFSNFIYLGKNGVDYFPLLKTYLVKEVGFKENEVGIINGKTSLEAREEIKEGFNKGEIKVLIGGDPTKEGIDLQENGYATFNLALGWNPTEMAQVEGRIWRQGNKRSKVLQIYPLVENSGDISIYQKFEEKGSRINDLFSYEGKIFDTGELDPLEKKLALITNPEYKAEIEIQLETKKLNRDKVVFDSLADDLEKFKTKIEGYKKDIKTYGEEVERFKNATDDWEKRRLKESKQKLKNSKSLLEAEEKKLIKKEVKSFEDLEKRLEENKKKAEELKEKIDKIKETKEERVKKFQKEYEENLKKTKGIEDHKNDIRKTTEDLKVYSNQELADMKAELVHEYNSKNGVVKSDFEKKIIKAGGEEKKPLEKAKEKIIEKKEAKEEKESPAVQTAMEVFGEQGSLFDSLESPKDKSKFPDPEADNADEIKINGYLGKLRFERDLKTLDEVIKHYKGLLEKYDLSKDEDRYIGTRIQRLIDYAGSMKGYAERDIKEESKTKTQKEVVEEVLANAEEGLSIQDVVKATGILEPNIRRILGQGAKDGNFTRIDKGIYTLNDNGSVKAIIKAGDTLENLPKLAKAGFKTDMVFLDIPYKTPAVIGGNRGVKEYSFISPEQFDVVMKSLKEIVRDEETPIYYMFSQAPSGMKAMEKYNKAVEKNGFKLVDSGGWTKLFANGNVATNMRGNKMPPEGIRLYTLSGKFSDKTKRKLDFELVRPKGYTSEKPLELARELVKQGTKKGDTVLDPFAGSGVIGEGAVREGRNIILLEKNEKAIEEHIKPRIEKAVKEGKKEIEKDLKLEKKEVETLNKIEEIDQTDVLQDGANAKKQVENIVTKKDVKKHFKEKTPLEKAKQQIKNNSEELKNKFKEDKENLSEESKKLYDEYKKLDGVSKIDLVRILNVLKKKDSYKKIKELRGEIKELENAKNTYNDIYGDGVVSLVEEGLRRGFEDVGQNKDFETRMENFRVEGADGKELSADDLYSEIGDKLIKLNDKISKLKNDLIDYKDGFSATELKKMETRLNEKIKDKKKITELNNLIKEYEEGRREIKTTWKDRYENLKKKYHNLKIEKFKRRKEVKSILDYFSLTDTEVKSINNRDVGLMTDEEFGLYKKEIKDKAESKQERNSLVDKLVMVIEERDLKKVENLQEALELPKIKDMTNEQITKFTEALELTLHGDTFLGKRKIQTLENTDLAGVKTVSQIKRKIEQATGMKVGEDLAEGGWADLIKFDRALADSNPVYRYAVNSFNESSIKSRIELETLREDYNELLRKARESRYKKDTEGMTKLKKAKYKLKQSSIPNDQLIIEFLEKEKPEEKIERAKEMTSEEIKLALFVRNQYEKYRDELYRQEEEMKKIWGLETLKRWRENYTTHVQRGFFESWNQAGFKFAWGEFWTKQDQNIFFKGSGDTGEVLGLEKFFKFSMPRTGSIVPTLDLSKRFMTYSEAFYKKKALDEVLPTIETASYFLLDKVGQNFVRQWLNNKKGQRIDKKFQGSSWDRILQGYKIAISIKDLGLNLMSGIASSGGSFIANYSGLGAKSYLKGIERRYLDFKKSEKITNKYLKGTIGMSPLERLKNSNEVLQKKAIDTLFLFMSLPSYNAMKTNFIAQLSDLEWKTGEVSLERLREIKKNIGEFHPLSDDKSVGGSTAFGGLYTQYKTWMVPLAYSTIKNTGAVIDKIKNGESFSDISSSKEFGIATRLLIADSAIVAFAWLLLTERDDSEQKAYEKSHPVLAKMQNKLIRELGSVISTFKLGSWSSVRVIQELEKLQTALVELVKLEEYKTSNDYYGYEEGDLKGLNKLKKLFTPSFVNMFDFGGGEKTISSSSNSSRDRRNRRTRRSRRSRRSSRSRRSRD